MDTAPTWEFIMPEPAKIEIANPVLRRMAQALCAMDPPNIPTLSVEQWHDLLDSALQAEMAQEP